MRSKGMGFEQIQNKVEQYAAEVLSRANDSDWQALSLIIQELINVKERGRKIFTAGNGGSLATASHMANDFTKGCRVEGRAGFDIECFGDANAVITCLANDFSYDEIFSILLETKGKKGDVFVYFSGSGNSPNLINAAKVAREMGIVTIGFLGRDGGALKSLSDLYMIAPSCIMEQIEDMHMIYEHNMVCAIRSILGDDDGGEPS